MSMDFLSDEWLKRLEQGRWLVGVSGGGDSVALLRLLVDAGLKDRLMVGNFEHGWGRFGRESQDYVASLSADLGMDFVTGKGRGRAETNAEEVAREERYAWFGKVCRGEKLDGVLVAHTEDDAVETFLMRLGKGSGLQGLAGMKDDTEVLGVRVMRPLLGASRDALRVYLQGLKQNWMEDPDNEAGGSQRARVRRLLPMLEMAGVSVQGIGASMQALAQADEVVRRAVDEVKVTWQADFAEMELAGLKEVLPEVGARVMGRLIDRLAPGQGVVRRGKRVRLLGKLQSDAAGAATLGGLKFEWGDGVVRVTKEKI